MSDENAPTGTTIITTAPNGARPAPIAPPHPMDGEWYMYADGQQFGPFTGHRMKEFAQDGRLTRETDVVRAGGTQWAPAFNDPILSSLFSILPPMVPAVQPSMPAGQLTAGQGATIVQVTNNLASPTAPAPQMIIVDGEAKSKSAGLALVLSILCVGLGQIYNGNVGKGILMFFGCILLWFAFLGWIIMIWSWVDAYRTAKRLNERYERRLAAGLVL